MSKKSRYEAWWSSLTDEQRREIELDRYHLKLWHLEERIEDHLSGAPDFASDALDRTYNRRLREIDARYGFEG